MSTIAIDARELRTSTGRYIERLIHYLQQIDHKNDYIILLKPQDMAGWRPSNPRFTKVAAPYKEFTFGEQLGFKKQIAGLRADLVHFPMVQQPVLYRGKTVTTIQDLTTVRFRNPSKNWLVFTIKQTVYKAVNWYVPRKSAQLIVPTEFVKHDLMHYAHIGPEKITVTLESSDPLPAGSDPLPDLTDKQFIMYVGRPLPAKNLWRLAQALQLLQKDHPALHLAIVGKRGPMHDDLERRVRAAGIQNVLFTGFVSDARLRWMYEHTAAYVFPSLSEGFGLPGLEAMRHGAPVASSDATSLPEVHGDAAHYFDPLDIRDMAAKIADILDDPALRQKLIAAGHKQVSKFSWRRMAEQTLAVYEKALQNT